MRDKLARSVPKADEIQNLLEWDAYILAEIELAIRQRYPKMFRLLKVPPKDLSKLPNVLKKAIADYSYHAARGKALLRIQEGVSKKSRKSVSDKYSPIVTELGLLPKI